MMVWDVYELTVSRGWRWLSGCHVRWLVVWMVNWEEQLERGSTDKQESLEFEDHGNPGGGWSRQVGERDWVHPLSYCSFVSTMWQTLSLGPCESFSTGWWSRGTQLRVSLQAHGVYKGTQPVSVLPCHRVKACPGSRGEHGRRNGKLHCVGNDQRLCIGGSERWVMRELKVFTGRQFRKGLSTQRRQQWQAHKDASELILLQPASSPVCLGVSMWEGEKAGVMSFDTEGRWKRV